MWIILLVIGGVRDFQVLHGQARDIIHGNLKVHRDRPDVFPAFRGSGLAKCDLSDEGVLVAPLELLDSPLSNLLLRLILEALALDTLRQLVGHAGGRAGDGESHAHLRREVVLRELRADFHCKAQAIARVLIHEGVDAERGAVLAVNAVVHDEEFSVGRIDRNRLHGLEIARVHALMEVAIVEGYTTLLARG